MVTETLAIGEIRKGRDIGKNGSDRNRSFILRLCKECGKPDWVAVIKGRMRSEICRACSRKSTRNGNWNGGIRHGGGYVFILSPEHPFANKRGYVNGIKDDDRPENLEEVSRRQHADIHRGAEGRLQPVTECHCAFCNHRGVYGVDIIDQDYYDEITRHDTTKCSCRDLEACYARGGRTRAIY